MINTHWKIGWPGHAILTISGSIFGQSPVRGKQQNLKFRESSAFLQGHSIADKHTLEDGLARTHNFEYVWQHFLANRPLEENIRIKNFARVLPFLQGNSTVDKHTLGDRPARAHNFEYFLAAFLANPP